MDENVLNQFLLQGYNGSQLWDAAFIVQAIISSNLTEEYGPTLRKVHTFIKNTQVMAIFAFIIAFFNWFVPVHQNLHSFFVFSPKILENCPGDQNKWFRHISKGSWPFSTVDHGWPTSDCTAEGLKVTFFTMIWCYFFLIFILSFLTLVIIYIYYNTCKIYFILHN